MYIYTYFKNIYQQVTHFIIIYIYINNYNGDGITK